MTVVRKKSTLGATPGNADGCENMGVAGGAMRIVVKRKGLQIDGSLAAVRELAIEANVVYGRLGDARAQVSSRCLAARQKQVYTNLP